MRISVNHVICSSLCILLFLLPGCLTQHATNGTTYDAIHGDIREAISDDQAVSSKTAAPLPTAVSDALLPPFPGQNQAARRMQHHFNVTADNMPARQFFMGLVDGTPVNMVVNPEVTGDITLHLKNVTIRQAIEVVHDVYGYAYRKTALGYEILPRKMENAMFSVNYLDVRRSGKSTMELNSGQISEKITGPTVSGNSGTGDNQPTQTQSSTTTMPSGSSVDTRSEMDFWKGLKSALTSMVGTVDGRSVIVNPQAGVVMVHAYPDELYQVGRFIDRIQAHMGRQVVIEAKILEVQLNDQFQSGINWNVLGKGNPALNDGGASQSGLDSFSSISGATALENFTSIFTLNLGKGQFNALIQLLQTQGNVQVISSPRISTINNQKAVIKVGTDQFFVTGVSTDNTVTANSTIPTQNVSLTPFFSGVTFDVTPEISGDDMITLHIHPSVSVVTEQTQTIQLGQTSTNNPNTLVLPLAMSTIRESDNIVRAHNGQVVVIGGLMQNNRTEQTAGMPVLSRLPFIGTLFRRTSQISQKSELVILLRPVVVDNRVWTDVLQRSDHAFHQLKRGFHTGGLPDVFGNEGEREQS